MKKIEIGTVITQYNEAGELLSAKFVPTLTIELSNEIKKDLEQNISKSEESDVIKFNADFVLGTFFAKMTEIELADREKQEIVSEVVYCAKYQSGKVKYCVLKYYFQDRLTVTAQA